MGSRLNKALQLSGSDWVSLVHAWWKIGLVDLGLRLTTYDRVEQWLRSEHSQAEEDTSAKALRLYRLVAIAARYHPLPARCLHRSLVLMHLLERAGISAEVRLGVRRSDGEFGAHAWVEHKGVPIGDGEGAGFAPLESRSRG